MLKLSPRSRCSLLAENCNKSLVIKDNNAYTEDNVLIYNIFAYDIPLELEKDDVRYYFSKFGEVLDIKLGLDIRDSLCTTFKVAFVKFVDPESACSVLQKTTHHLHGSRIGVMADDSWNQPNADKARESNKNEDDVASTSMGTSKEPTTTYGGTHIFSLNDDCIEAIFGYLSLKEQVCLARVCERFQDIFEILNKRQFQNFDLNNIRDMTLGEKQYFFRFSGGKITSIRSEEPFRSRKLLSIVVLIRQFCRKLKCIHLEYSDMRNDCLKKLLHGYPQLQELTLRNCYLNDNSIKTMTHLHRLETLDLQENDKLSGKFISKMVQLKVLNLYGCYNIKSLHLTDICKSLPHLRSLDIRRCEYLSGTVFDALVEHCKELEILKLPCPELAFDCVALLPRLKQLELLGYSFTTAQKFLLAELVAHKANQLEILKVSTKKTLRADHFALISELKQLKKLFVPDNDINDDALIKFCKLQQLEDLTIQRCRNISNEGLLILVKSCPRLRRLNIKFCEQITLEFLLETISFLTASEKRKKPLVLLAHGTAMEDYDATAYEKVKEAEKQSLISVIFSPSHLELGEEDDIYALWDGE